MKFKTDEAPPRLDRAKLADSVVASDGLTDCDGLEADLFFRESKRVVVS